MEEETKAQLLNLNNDIPFELLQAILLDVAQQDLPSRIVTPFVCHQWNNILKVLPQPKHMKTQFGPQRPSGCKAMAIAARKGHHSLLKWFHEQGCPWDQGCCAAAARGGHLDVLMWLKDQGCPFEATPAWYGAMRMTKWRQNFLSNNPSPDTDLYAVQWGIRTKEKVLQWANNYQKHFMGRAGAKAAKGGHLKVLQWAVANGFPVGKSTMIAAAGVGQLGIIKWLVKRKCVWHEWAALETAALGGHLDVIQWILEIHPDPSDLLSLCDGATAQAAKGGHLHVLKWLLEKGFFVGGDAWIAAAEKGHLEALQLLKERQLLVNSEEMDRAQDAAAGNGHLAILKWMREIGCPWGSITFARAASDGGWETLMWLKEQGCPWGDGAIWGAAQKGRIDVVKWLRDQGCPWDGQACFRAASAGHFEMVKWLKEQGCLRIDLILLGACRGGFLDIVIWAKENGCHESSLDDTLFCKLAAEGGHLNILKWLREQGFPWDCMTASGAGCWGRSDVFFWAVENGCPLGRPLEPRNE